MAPHFRTSKLFLIMLLMVCTIPLASSASSQHHPFSEIFPPDTNLGFGDQALENASSLELQNGFNFTDYTIYDQGNTKLLEWNQSTSKWEVRNADLDLNSRSITNLATPTSGTDAATKNYVDNNDDTGTDDQTLGEVLSQGNSAGTNNLDMNDNSIKKAFLNTASAQYGSNYIGQHGNAFYHAQDRWTCSGDCPPAMFDGDPASRGSWGSSSTPIQFAITFGSVEHYWSAFRIHFNWRRYTDSFTIERRDDSDQDGSCSDESGWYTLEDVNSNSNAEYLTTNTGGSWACGFRFTFNRTNSDLNYDNDFRIGEVVAYRYYNGVEGLYMTKEGGKMYGNIDLNSNTLRDVGGIVDDSGTSCGSNEFLNGNGICEADTDTDNQNLAEVLSQGNAARGSTAIVDRFYADDHGIGGTPGISLAVGDTDTGLHSDTDGRLEFWTNAGERFSLTNSELKSQGADLNMNGNPITNADWSNANDLDGSGNLVSGSVSDNEIADNTVDNSEIQNGVSFTFNGITSNGNLNMNGNEIQNVGGRGNYIEIGDPDNVNGITDSNFYGMDISWDTDNAFIGLRDYGSDRKDVVISNEQPGDNVRLQLDGSDRLVARSSGVSIEGGNLDINGNRIDNVGSPDTGDDAVSRNYADNRYTNQGSQFWWAKISLADGFWSSSDGSSGDIGSTPSVGSEACDYASTTGVCVQREDTKYFEIEFNTSANGLDWTGNGNSMCWATSTGDNENNENSWGHGARSISTDGNGHCATSVTGDCAQLSVASDSNSHDAYGVMCFKP